MCQDGKCLSEELVKVSGEITQPISTSNCIRTNTKEDKQIILKLSYLGRIRHSGSDGWESKIQLRDHLITLDKIQKVKRWDLKLFLIRDRHAFYCFTFSARTVHHQWARPFCHLSTSSRNLDLKKAILKLAKAVSRPAFYSLSWGRSLANHGSKCVITQWWFKISIHSAYHFLRFWWVNFIIQNIQCWPQYLNELFNRLTFSLEKNKLMTAKLERRYFWCFFFNHLYRSLNEKMLILIKLRGQFLSRKKNPRLPFS